MIKKGIKYRIAEMGKIKIGGKGASRPKQNGGTFQLPVRYEHFVVTTTERDPKTGNFFPDKAIMEKLGPDPKEIKIRFLFDDIDMNFFTFYAYYNGRRCQCRGDGEEATMTFTKDGTPQRFTLIDEGPKTVKAGQQRKIKCDRDTCPFAQPDDKGNIRCKYNGILSCVLEDSPAIGAVYKFRTTSKNSVENITSSLKLLKVHSGGVLVGLPLKLQFLKKSTEEHGNVPVVNVIFDGENYQQMREAAMLELKNRSEHGNFIKMIETSAIASGILEDTDNEADIAAEFYPEDITYEDQPDNITDRVDEIMPDLSDITTEKKTTTSKEEKTTSPESNNQKKDNKKEEKSNEKESSKLDLF